MNPGEGARVPVMLALLPDDGLLKYNHVCLLLVSKTEIKISVPSEGVEI